MIQELDCLTRLRRPRLLMRAARLAFRDYDRRKLLRRLLGADRMPRAEQVLPVLLEEEAGLEAARRLGDAAYSAGRHIEVLVALIGEARLLARRAAG